MNNLNKQPAQFKSGFFALTIALIAALGGLLFGYDTGIIGVALFGLSKQFVMDDSLKQIVTGAIIFGALFGCIGTGPLSERFGRRKIVLVVALCFAIGSLLSSLAMNVPVLILARLLLGLSVGSSTQIIPVYIAEVASPKHRGKMVALFQFMVVTGITLAYGTGFILGEHWRLMFGLGLIPAVVLGIGMVFLPESPRWLVMQQQDAKALQVLTKLRHNRQQAENELAEIHTVTGQKQGKWRDLLTPSVRPAVIVGTGIAMFSQITGNNALIYYAPTLLTQAGFSEKTAIISTGGSTILVIVMTVLGSLLVDKIGRRKYLLWTIPGSIVALVLMGLLFLGQGPNTPVSQGLVVFCLAAYLMLNCGGFGVCIWLINAEVYPLFIRGKGASIGAFSHWFFDLLVTLTTLSLVTMLGAAGAFGLYAGISLLALIFIIFLVPETKGKSLEVIEKELRDKQFFPYQKRFQR